MAEENKEKTPAKDTVPPVKGVPQAAEAQTASPEAGKPAAAPAKKAGFGAFLASLKPREKFLLKASFVVVLGLVLDLGVFHPIGEYLSELDQKILFKESVIRNRFSVFRYKQRILSEYKGVVAYMTDPSVSQEEEIAKLLREIEKVSKQVRFFVFNINPVKANKKSDSVYELAVDIEGKGNIEAVRQFMKLLESSNPNIRIDGFNLKPQSKDSEELRCLFSVIKIGVKKDNSVLGL